MNFNLVASFILILALAVAVVTDVRTHKIRNWLTFPVIVLGLVLNGLDNGAQGLLFSLQGIGVASLSLLLFVLIGGLGAGDVKLLWAIGALMGPTFALWTLLCTAIAGGVLGIGYAFKRGSLKHTVNNAFVGAYLSTLTRTPGALDGMVSATRIGRMPYAPAIALGAAVAAYLLHAKIV